MGDANDEYLALQAELEELQNELANLDNEIITKKIDSQSIDVGTVTPRRNKSSPVINRTPKPATSSVPRTLPSLPYIPYARKRPAIVLPATKWPVKRAKTVAPISEAAAWKECKKLLRTIFDNKNSWPFLEPVDPIKLGIPMYPQIIKNPMDLGTIRRNLNKNLYASINDFANDVRLVWSNCETFNGPISEFTRMAQELSTNFETRFKKISEAVSDDPESRKARALSTLDDLKKQQQTIISQIDGYKAEGYNSDGELVEEDWSPPLPPVPPDFDNKISFERKVALTRKVKKLDRRFLKGLYNLVQVQQPAALPKRRTEGAEVYVDIDNLPSVVLYQMEKYVTACFEQYNSRIGNENGSGEVVETPKEDEIMKDIDVTGNAIASKISPSVKRETPTNNSTPAPSAISIQSSISPSTTPITTNSPMEITPPTIGDSSPPVAIPTAKAPTPPAPSQMDDDSSSSSSSDSSLSSDDEADVVSPPTPITTIPKMKSTVNPISSTSSTKVVCISTLALGGRLFTPLSGTAAKTNEEVVLKNEDSWFALHGNSDKVSDNSLSNSKSQNSLSITSSNELEDNEEHKTNTSNEGASNVPSKNSFSDSSQSSQKQNIGVSSVTSDKDDVGLTANSEENNHLWSDFKNRTVLKEQKVREKKEQEAVKQREMMEKERLEMERLKSEKERLRLEAEKKEEEEKERERKLAEEMNARREAERRLRMEQSGGKEVVGSRLSSNASYLLEAKRSLGLNFSGPSTTTSADTTT